MSSNIRLQRICELCDKEFIARTTVTKYCSDTCSKRAYKLRKRAEKVEASQARTRKTKTETQEDLKVREFLTVTQVSKLIGCSRQNVYKLINSGKLEATNLLEKKTIVKRSDLDKLFEKSKSEAAPKRRSKPETKTSAAIQDEVSAETIDMSDSYTLVEIMEKFGISESTLYQLIKKNDLSKSKIGGNTYVSKSSIDSLLNHQKPVTAPRPEPIMESDSEASPEPATASPQMNLWPSE